MSKPIRVGIVGATGYTGTESVRLLESHLSAAVVYATSDRLAGQPLNHDCPWLASDLTLEAWSPARAADCDVLFWCRGNGELMQKMGELPADLRVVDFSADFRLRDTALYADWYGMDHACKDLNPWPVYGMPEVVSPDHIAQARIVANPGCYPTATLIALAPLARAGAIQGTPVIDAKSGVSGAGRSRTEVDYLFTELSDGFRGYKLSGHRHTPEIEQELGMHVRFTPHLIPAARGIYVTAHIPLADGWSAVRIRDLWRGSYAERPFVGVLEGVVPSTKMVRGSNRCLIAVEEDSRTGMAIVVSVIDNLVKGAAGQAVQNMNLMFRLPEATGLPRSGMWP